MTYRVLVEPGTLEDGATIDLDEAERHHLRVRRVETGAAVMVLDGAGRSAPGTLFKDGERIAVAIGVVQVAPAYPATIVAVGAGDKDRFLLLAERCTELAVSQLVPLDTERTGTVSNRVRSGALDRIRRRAREACKQSGNPWATVVAPVCDLPGLMIRWPGARWLLADAAGRACPGMTAEETIGWIIGPEGGLAAAESEYCRRELAAEPVALGTATLRFDTAAVAAAVLTQDRRHAR